MTAKKIRPGDQEQTDEDEDWKTPPPDYSARDCLNALVSKVIAIAKAKPLRFTTKEIVCERIVADMEKTSYNYIILDLKERHSKWVANLFGCEISEVRNEFVRLLYDPTPEEFYQWDDYTSDYDPTKRSNVKSPDYHKKNSRINFLKNQVPDDPIYKEETFDLASLVCGLPKNRKNRCYKKTDEEIMKLFVMNLKWFDFTLSELEIRDYEKFAKIFETDVSTVTAEFHRISAILEGEKETRRREIILDDLVSRNIETAKNGKGKIKRNSLTKRQFITRLRFKMKRQSLHNLGLKHRHFDAIARFFKCEVLEIINEFNRPRTTPKPKIEAENYRASQTPAPNPEDSDPSFVQDQENYEEEPTPKRSKYAPELEIQENEDDDPDPEQEYQMGYYDDPMDYWEAAYDPGFQDPTAQYSGEDWNSWDYTDGFLLPVDRSPELYEYDEPEHEEMEVVQEYEEAPELQYPNRPTLDYVYGVPVDEEPAPLEYEERVTEEMEVEEHVPMTEERKRIQDHIDNICHCAAEIFNDQTFHDFKGRTLLRELFNTLADENLSLELTNGQFDQLETSFNCDRKDIEKIFAFYKSEKVFLDKMDRGRPEDQNISRIIDKIVTANKDSLSKNPEDENFLNDRTKILEFFYQKTVENKTGAILSSRQKRQLAAYLGLSVTEIMSQLKEIRNLLKKNPAPKKKIVTVKLARVIKTTAGDNHLKKYFENYRERLDQYGEHPNHFGYDTVLYKVIEQFGFANEHVTNTMTPLVKEQYRTAFLILLYTEMSRKLSEGEMNLIAEFLRMKKNIAYIRRKEKQFFETGKIEIDKF